MVEGTAIVVADTPDADVVVEGTADAAGEMMFVTMLVAAWGMLLSMDTAALTVVRLAVLKPVLLDPAPPPPPPPPLQDATNMAIAKSETTHFEIEKFLFWKNMRTPHMFATADLFKV